MVDGDHGIEEPDVARREAITNANVMVFVLEIVEPDIGKESFAVCEHADTVARG
jgi:hypothetical protein